MKTINKIRLVFIIIISLGLTYSSLAQSKSPEYKIIGNEIVKVETVKVSAKQTNYKFKTKDTIYNAMETKKGNFYIVVVAKVSRKKHKKSK